MRKVSGSGGRAARCRRFIFCMFVGAPSADDEPRRYFGERAAAVVSRLAKKLRQRFPTEEAYFNWFIHLMGIRGDPVAPHFFFESKDFFAQDEYELEWRVSSVFPLHTTGFATHRDKFAISISLPELKARIEELANPLKRDADLRDEFNLQDTRDWKLNKARQNLQGDNR